MADQFMSRCGIDCKTCTCREEMNCPGCLAAQGKIFWGECDVAKCVIEKGLEHCGMCKDMPCSTLNEYAYNEELGCNGECIETLREWNAQGYDAWRARMS